MTQSVSQEEKLRRHTPKAPASEWAAPISGGQETQSHAMPHSGLNTGLMRKLQADPKSLAPNALAPNQVLQLQRLVGNRTVQRLLAPQRAATAQSVSVAAAAPQVQMLRVDAADTQYEDEADQIADAVVQGKRLNVQRSTGGGGGSIGPEGGDVDQGMERRIKGATGGGSLPGSVRNVLEPKLGVDLKGVKVHTGAKSADLNRRLNAKAFTYKNNIFYGGGQSPSNLSLTTHEVVHTMHQGAVRKKAATEEDA